MSIEWSSQQDDAIKAVKRWFKSKSGPQVFRLFGYAGTGKTTLAKAIANELCDGDVLYGAIFDEAVSFRDDAIRWRYTAVTRAAERLTMVL